MIRPPAPRNTRSTARGASRGRAAATSMRSESGSPGTATTVTSRGAPRGPRDITVGRVLKWIAIAIGSWLLLSLVLFLISAQTRPGVSPATERALSSSGNLFSGSNILVLGFRRPQGRLDRQVAGRPRPLRHDHARPLRLRERAEALHPARRGGEHPRARREQGERGLRLRRPGPDDPDARELPRQRSSDQPRGRGGLRGVPALHRRARGRDREQQDTDLLAPVRQLLEGTPLQEGRAPPRRTSRARLLTRPQERVRAERGRPRPRAPPAGRCWPGSARRRSPRARSSGCPG